MDATRLRNLEIDKTNLDEELAKQAANFLFVAEKAVEVEARYLLMKMHHEALIAKLDGKVRDINERAGKKTTEKVVENAIILDAEYQESAKNLNNVRTQKEVLKALKEAWYHRKDLLIRLAINQRAEIDGFGSETLKASA